MYPSNSPHSNSIRTDRRKNRTRRMLSEALFALMDERPYETITIEDITQRADLGRTTFYLHYKDKEELLLESIEAIAEELKAKVFAAMKEDDSNSEAANGNHPPGWKPITMVLQHAAANTSLYLPILRGEGTPRAPACIRQIIYEGAYDFFEKRMAQNQDAQHSIIPVEVLTNFFSTSLLGMLTWWLENNMPYPAEQMTEIYSKLFFSGARQVLTNNDPGHHKMREDY